MNKRKTGNVLLSADRRDNYRTRKIGKMDYPFLFDESLKPKPVFYKIINY